MNSALFARANSVFPYQDPAGVQDFSAKNGLLIAAAAIPNANAGVQPPVAAFLQVSTSATVPAIAVCLNGNPVGVDSDFGTLGKIPPVRLCAGAAINMGDRVIQNNDGTVLTDSGPGNARVIVGVALETAAAGDFFLVDTLAPVIGS